MPNLRRFRAAGLVQPPGACVDLVNGLIRDLDIKPADPTMPVKNLSGGNRQKIVIAKWLASGARVYLMNDPTKAVDVGAKAEIYRLLGNVVTDGGAVLLVSSDMDELIGLSDRVLVLRGAQLVEEFPDRPIAKDRLLAAVVGSRREPMRIGMSLADLEARMRRELDFVSYPTGPGWSGASIPTVRSSMWSSSAAVRAGLAAAFGLDAKA